MQSEHTSTSLIRSAIQATLHCLTGCAIGEILGMVLATALALGNAASIALSVALAFGFGYSLTLRPVLRAGVPLRKALGLTFASDTVSITTMELVDNAFILLRPRRTRGRARRRPLLVEPRRQPRDRLRADRAREPGADRARPRPRRDARAARRLDSLLGHA